MTEKCILVPSLDSDQIMLATKKDYPEFVIILDKVISCFLINISAVIGIMGNIITLIVLSRSRFTDTSNIVLLSMAACDLFYILNLAFRKLDCLIDRYDPVLAEIYQAYTLRYFRAPGLCSVFISMAHIVVISLERLVAVFYPLMISRLITRKKIVILLAFIYLGWITLLFPYATFYLEVQWTFNRLYNRSIPTPEETQWFIENKLVLDFLSNIVMNCLTGVCPFIVAANCCAVAYKLHHVSKQRRLLTFNTADKNGNDAKVSKMLLVVCIVFCLFNIPSSIFYIYFYLDPSMKPPNKLNSLLRNLDELILSINSAANFFIYILMSSKFYNSVVSLFGFRTKNNSHQ